MARLCGRRQGRTGCHHVIHQQHIAPGNTVSALWMHGDGAIQRRETLVLAQTIQAGCRAGPLEQIRAMIMVNFPRQRRR